MAAIDIQNIVKTYGEKKALNGVSLSIEKGELFGLIGPDGAGKTSLMRILVTLLLADSGTAAMSGHDVVTDYKTIRNITGYMPGRFSLYQDLTVEENLNFFATIFGTTIKENYSLIRDIYVQLEPFKDRRAGKLSGGMKQKLALCCALIHRPEILILDEPTTGVDAVSRREFWELLKSYKNEGITTFVSTPYMDEAGLCERIALIQDGHIMDTDSPDEIIRRFPLPLYTVKASPMTEVLHALRSFGQAPQVWIFGQEIHFVASEHDISEDKIRQYLTDKNLKVDKVEIITPGIEDCFLWNMRKS
ncbi:MAG: ATPase [Bacteroidetes bacterium HGW-Bacteroidetes-21]|nr:MAG: ATPase [Bacteroidetes bacterium HGW-Bacteroidetes-21]